MSEIVLREVANRKDLKAFVKFPFSLYKDNEYWVSPLIMDEMESFNPAKNPSYEYCETKLWLAYKNDTIVGRVAGIKHGPEFENEKKIRFGRIDFIDDPEVSASLINAVQEWGKELGAEHIHGPLGFNDMDLEGLLVEGFDTLSTIATMYSYPYYKDHLENLGLLKAEEWIELSGDFEPRIPERLKRGASYVSERFKVHPVDFKNSKIIKSYGHNMFRALNESYGGLYGFYPLTQKEIDLLINKYLTYVSKNSLSMIVNEQDKVVAFAVTVPSLSRAIQKARGRLFPFGFLYIAKALLFNKEIDLYLIGVHPDYQNTGVISVLFYDLWQKYNKMNIQCGNANPLLETNEKMLKVWNTIAKNENEDFQSHITKRRRCYTKPI